MQAYLAELLELLGKTGSVMLPLMIVGLLLWYGLGYRAIVLFTFDRQSLRGIPGCGSRARAEEALFPHRQDIARYSVLNDTLVGLAPLLGLLGTVTGMIETFDAIGESVLLSATGGGIAGGISEALFSTQVGLVIAVPGLLIGRLLDRRREELELELDRVLSLAEVTALGGARA